MTPEEIIKAGQYLWDKAHDVGADKITGSLSPDRELKVMNIGTGSPSGDREPVNGIVFQ